MAAGLTDKLWSMTDLATDSPEYPPKHREVYHDHDDCHDGKAIEAQHRESGTGGKEHCKVCTKLG